MRNLLYALISFASLLPVSGCATVTPGTAVIGVWVTSPTEAERYTVIRGGRYWSGVNWDYYKIPTIEQRSVWTQAVTEGSPTDESISFAGKDGQPVNVDIGIGYIVAEKDEDLIKMVKLYGLDLDQTIDGRVRDSVRNALNMCASTYNVEAIYGEQKQAIMDCALNKLQTEYGPNGLNFTRLTLNSEVRLPDKVKTAMEASTAASQEAEMTRRQVEQAKAEGEKTLATAEADAQSTLARATAQAQANDLLSKSLTPQVIEQQKLDVQRKWVEKWNGVLPTTALGSDGTTYMIGEK